MPLEHVGDSRSSKNVKVSGSETHGGSLPLGEALSVLTGPVCPEHLPTSSLLHSVMWRERASCLDPAPQKCMATRKSFVLLPLYFFCKVTSIYESSTGFIYIIMINYFLVRVRK